MTGHRPRASATDSSTAPASTHTTGWSPDATALHTMMPRQAAPVPNSAAMNTGLTADRLIDCIAGWRIDLAADLLLEPGATVGSVASRVGYGSPYALSTAFTRLRGVSPAQHRAGARVG
jgi:methylphosphotriester-DNA--protein-cysteine methyltransferase